MHLSDFDFDLPDHLIATFPLDQRTASRLLCLNKQTGQVAHRQFTDLLGFLTPNDLLVFNNTKVIPARWYGRKASGGQLEMLIERILGTDHALAHIRSSKSPRAGSMLHMESDILLEVISRQDDLYAVKCHDERPLLTLLETYGHVPLPPYMEREDQPLDQQRYQTVYAKREGAVAAPTAGLHFDEEFLDTIQKLGCETAFLTLHVGAGTFQPVRTELITQHQMHAEYLEVTLDVCEKVSAAQARGGRVIAVGTTSVRALETAAQNGTIEPYQGDTRMFIYPDYRFRCVDALITNFHLPKSTLLMLVCALGGYQAVMRAYQDAIAEGYRFYSYGDAMFIS